MCLFFSGSEVRLADCMSRQRFRNYDLLESPELHFHLFGCYLCSQYRSGFCDKEKPKLFHYPKRNYALT